TGGAGRVVRCAPAAAVQGKHWHPDSSLPALASPVRDLIDDGDGQHADGRRPGGRVFRFIPSHPCVQEHAGYEAVDGAAALARHAHPGGHRAVISPGQWKSREWISSDASTSV